MDFARSGLLGSGLCVQRAPSSLEIRPWGRLIITSALGSGPWALGSRLWARGSGLCAVGLGLRAQGSELQAMG